MKMRSVIPMKAAKTGYILISCLLCLMGILFIVKPNFSTSFIGILCGIVLIVFGLVKLIGYFSRDLYRLAFQYDLAFGILLIALGIMILAHPKSLMNFICITLGLSILADGLFKIQISVESRRFGIHNWWIILILAVITGIMGLLLMFHPSQSGYVLTMLLGVSLVVEGILNLGTVLATVKIIKHQRPDTGTIEIDYYEESED